MKPFYITFTKEFTFIEGGIKPYEDLDTTKLTEILLVIQKKINEIQIEKNISSFKEVEKICLAENRFNNLLQSVLVAKPLRIDNISYKTCGIIKQIFNLSSNYDAYIDMIFELKSSKYLYLTTSFNNDKPIIVCADLENEGEICLIDINKLNLKTFLSE